MKIRLNTHPQSRHGALRLVVVLVMAGVLAACAGSGAFRAGQRNSEKGDWDLAVARFTRALASSPKNIKYKIALENAKIQASRFHTEKARKLHQAGSHEKAKEEYGIAAGYDPSNKAATDEMAAITAMIEKLEKDKRLAVELSNRRPAEVALPIPLLSPRVLNVITLNMTGPLDKVYQTLGKMAGVNVVFDPDMQNPNKVITVNVGGVRFQEALDQIGLVNKRSYRVLDQNTLLVFDDSNATLRMRWDDQVMRTFYLENVEAKDLEAVLKTALGAQARVSKNESANALTVISTPEEMALADRFIRSNDKPKGEILVEVEILEINRTNAKEYGLQLSNYQVGVELQPTGVAGEVSGGLTNLRAHLLSSLNASDWVVQIPSAIFSKFLHDDSIVKILSSPKVRAFEGEKAIFKIGTEVPIPQFFPGYAATTQPGQPAGGYGGTTSATYKTVGVNLEIDKAKVTGSNEITMKLKAEFSLIGEDKVFGVGASAINYPQFLTRSVENTLRLTDGVTAVIGGMLTSREASSVKGALGVSSIPLLNKILGGQQRREEEIEILISLTPRILRATTITAEDVEPMYLGLKGNLRIPGVRPLFGPIVEPAANDGTSGSAAASASPTPVASPPVAPRSVATPAPTPAPVATPTPEPPSAPLASLPGAEPSASEASPGNQPPGRTPPVPPPPGGPLASRSAWDRTEVRMKVGEVQRVGVNVFNLRSTSAVDLAVLADSNAIEFVEIDPGQLLSIDGVPVLAERKLEGVRASAQFKRSTPLAGGTGIISTIGFRAVRPGEVTIFLENLVLSSGSATGAIPLTGAVRVTVTP